MTSHRRGPWSQGEDAYLCQLVHSQGALNWVRIAQLIGSRSPKQCRERYHQNLKPTLNHEPISPEEGVQIERMVAEMGKRWAEIARRLHGRSDNAVKNWWNGSMNRRRRLIIRRKSSASSYNTNSSSPQYHHHYDDDSKYSLSYPHPQSSLPSPLINESAASPTVSEASRSESVDGTPSLVSDAGSPFSISPKLINSPSLELPPLHYQSRDWKHSNLAGLSPPLNRYSPACDTQSYLLTPPITADNKLFPSNTSSLPLHQSSPMSFFSSYPTHDTHLPQIQDINVRLPPLLLQNSCATSNHSVPRDSRMRLSTLLG